MLYHDSACIACIIIIMCYINNIMNLNIFTFKYYKLCWEAELNRYFDKVHIIKDIKSYKKPHATKCTIIKITYSTFIVQK